jgi:hypothetical protein
MASSPRSADKIVVSHAGALKDKYGAAGLARVREALEKLVAADARRHLRTKVVFIDRVNDMRPYGKITGPSSTPREAKRAIDAIYTAERPDYLMILGAWDVVPFQPLANPLWEKDGDDDDRIVDSDLPYACEAPYGTDPNEFVGPTRVVGRLPDIVNATDPAYLLKVLRIAAGAKTRVAKEYHQGFALSAQKWQASSDMSAKAIFGHMKVLRTCPDEGPAWAANRLAPRVHFINCHGNKNGTVYNGQPSGRREVYPIAHQAPWLTGKITNGAVMAAECCYGAQLYDPDETEGQPGIAYVYLAEGAYGVYGSSTIAYGPFSSNDSADLICQFFLCSVLQGASLGRAALEAWQQFAGRWSQLNPEHLKTISQFYLLGDPSIHPVGMAARTLNRTDVFKRAFAHTHDAGPRALRRDKLMRVGRSLDREMPRTRALPARGRAPISDEVSKVLKGAARESGIRRFAERHFVVVPRRGSPTMSGTRRTVHVLVSRGSPKREQTRQVTLITATAENGRLVHIRRSHSR